ncbi:MAG TPA: hypothetical protein VF018_17765 [Acidobacteriaceae bacterium]
MSMIFVLMRRRTSIRETSRRPLRRWTRFVPVIVGLASLACASASAQRDPFAELAPAPPPLDVPISNESHLAEAALPDAPTPNSEANELASEAYGSTSGTGGAPQHERQTSPGFPPVSPLPLRLPPAPGEHPSIPSLAAPCQPAVCTSTPASMCCARNVNYFQRFVDAGIHPLTPRQKAYLAFRNSIDPYNFATIGFFSAINVASDPSSAYGPGFPGFRRNFGVAYTESAVGEFFGTFLIPSIAHQDPHYHRLPNTGYARRILHAITQVGWAQSDYGTGMPNYATLVGTALDEGLGNLYVPGRDKSWGSAVARYSTGIATDPIGNFITEFLPDVARRVNIRIVLVQQIVNQVEKQQ